MPCFIELIETGKNGHHFANVIFMCNFLKESYCFLLIQMLLTKICSQGPSYNIPTLAQTMAWCQIGDKLLSELMIA